MGATANRKRRTVQRKLDFRIQIPEEAACSQPADLSPAPQPHPAASGSSQEEANLSEPASQPSCENLVSSQEAAAAPASSQDLAADTCVVDCATHLVMCLGANLARYVELYSLRKLEVKVCSIDTPDPVRRRRQEVLRQL